MKLNNTGDIGYTPVDCPGRNSHVDIFIDIGEGVTKTLIARVDLSKLGWAERVDRHLAQPYTQQILVKGKVPKPNTYKGLTWPRNNEKSGLQIP
jgi:hypothetical protein